jgi:hypothetical protein
VIDDVVVALGERQVDARIVKLVMRGRIDMIKGQQPLK